MFFIFDGERKKSLLPIKTGLKIQGISRPRHDTIAVTYCLHSL